MTDPVQKPHAHLPLLLPPSLRAPAGRNRDYYSTPGHPDHPPRATAPVDAPLPPAPRGRLPSAADPAAAAVPAASRRCAQTRTSPAWFQLRRRRGRERRGRKRAAAPLLPTEAVATGLAVRMEALGRLRRRRRRSRPPLLWEDEAEAEVVPRWSRRCFRCKTFQVQRRGREGGREVFDERHWVRKAGTLRRESHTYWIAASTTTACRYCGCTAAAAAAATAAAAVLEDRGFSCNGTLKWIYRDVFGRV